MTTVTTNPLVAPALTTSAKARPAVKSAPAIKLSQSENFILSAVAPSMAVLFTNPFDTVKVRLQLQGEARRVMGNKGEVVVAQKVYKNTFDCLAKTYKYEGIQGLQKGFTPAILKEASKNIFRLGMYDPILSVLHPTDNPTTAPAWKHVVAGAICGAMGALSSNPFELIKTRLQSSASGAIAVGHQHGYTSVTQAVKHTIRTSGIMGLYKGSSISISRSMLGSGANLSCYSLMKNDLMKKGFKDDVTLDMLCGITSAFVSVIFMNPVDVVRTRLYNYPSPVASSTAIISNIVRVEGLTAFYRGFSTHFLRIGPHFCLTFVFLGMLKRGLIEVKSQTS